MTDTQLPKPTQPLNPNGSGQTQPTPPPPTLTMGQVPVSGTPTQVVPPTPPTPPAPLASPTPAAPTPFTPLTPMSTFPAAPAAPATPPAAPTSSAPIPPAPAMPSMPPTAGPAKPVLPPGAVVPLAQAPILPGQPPKSTAPTAPTLPAKAPGTAPAGPAAPVLAGGSGGRFASLKSSPLKMLPFVAAGLAVIGLVIFVISKLLGGGDSQSLSNNEPGTSATTGTTKAPSKQVALTYWGLWEPEEVMEPILKEFEQANPGVLVKYEKQLPQDYRERLQTAVSSGQGPDVYRFHASWTPMLQRELAPMPASVYSLSDFQQIFYPSAVQQLQVNGQLVGVPVMYDGLALYYNKEVLTAAGATPPKTWAEVRELATKLTVRAGGKIERSGLAAGTASNVDHFSEIIGLLMLQNGADPADPTSQAALDAMTFYTNFSKVDKVWDETLPDSTVAFARGDVAMMFAPSWRYHEIVALNPSISVGVATVPKLATQQLGWASFWAEGVSAQSKNKDQSWALVKYLSSKEVMKKLYASQATVRTFGEIYSRKDLAAELSSDPIIQPFLSDATTAKSWYLNGWTFDNGINDQLIKYYEDAVTAVNTGKSVSEVMTTVAQGTKQVLRQFGVATTTTSTGTTTR